jgi:hypothetical protein
MRSACNLPDEQLCGCCTGIMQETPQAIKNRPALSAVTYRVGTYATFYASLLAALSDPDFPQLASLRTHSSSDFTIALLDTWAVALDIITFYQERFANEAFLRTAVDQRSVFELARLVGYVPSPGVSASAVLAFTLSSATGSPDNVLIPAGTRVQSVPGPGQKPQVFETSSDLTAVIALNALPAQTSQPWQLDPAIPSTWITGSANNVNVGDALLFLATSSGNPSATGPGDLRYVSRVVIDPASGDTQVWWNAPLTNTATSPTADIAIYIFRKKGALFGATAPNPYLLPPSTLINIPGHPYVPPATTTSSTAAVDLTIPLGSLQDINIIGTFKLLNSDWIFAYAGNGIINLDAAYTGLSPAGTSSAQLQWLVLTNSSNTAVFQITAASESNPNLYAVTAKTSQLTLSSSFAILSGSPGSKLDDALTTFTNETRTTTAYVSSNILTPATLPLTQWTGPTTFALAPGMIVPVQGSSVSVIGGQQITAQQPLGISGKRVRLQVAAGGDAIFQPASSSGSLPVADNQIFHANAFPPGTDQATGLPTWSVSTLSGIQGTLYIGAENLQLLPADKTDPVLSEAALANVILVAGNITTVSLASPLTGIYDATTVTVNANAVESTHGETVQEIMGNGDATNKALQFGLKQAPLTYVTAATGNGTQSTLQVWVNNLQWHEVSNLLADGPADRVFVTRPNQQGSRSVQFGNGNQGACTPTGQMNIRAVYRKGIGSAGMVAASQLSQPLDRPQGVKSVINPSAASGAADPASADDARQSAPLPTLTIGRIVSLEDYQNFALNFAGIAKALATWTWFGSRRGVFLSVAGENGAVLQSDDEIVLKLVAAMQAAGNRFIPIVIASYVPVLFQITASVKIDLDDYASEQVLAQVWSNLQNAFAFDSRQLAQNVVASEIVEIIQGTPGVIATQLRAVNPSGEPATGSPLAILCASGPMPPQGAQMLLLDPASQGMIGGWS